MKLIGKQLTPSSCPLSILAIQHAYWESNRDLQHLSSTKDHLSKMRDRMERYDIIKMSIINETRF